MFGGGFPNASPFFQPLPNANHQSPVGNMHQQQAAALASYNSAASLSFIHHQQQLVANSQMQQQMANQHHRAAAEGFFNPWLTGRHRLLQPGGLGGPHSLMGK